MIGFHPRSHKMDHGPRFPPKFIALIVCRNKYLFLQQPKQKIASRTEVDFSLLTFSIYVPDHDENEPVVAASAAAPPSLQSDLASRLACVPSVAVYESYKPVKCLASPIIGGDFSMGWCLGSWLESRLGPHAASPGVYGLKFNKPLAIRH